MAEVCRPFFFFWFEQDRSPVVVRLMESSRILFSFPLAVVCVFFSLLYCMCERMNEGSDWEPSVVVLGSIPSSTSDPSLDPFVTYK